MPELPDLHLMEVKINRNCKDKSFTKIVKSDISKNLAIESPFTLFSITAQVKGKELCLLLKNKDSEVQAGYEKEFSICLNMGMVIFR